MRVGARCWSISSQLNEAWDTGGCSVVDIGKGQRFIESKLKTLKDTLGDPPEDLKAFIFREIVNTTIDKHKQ